MDKVWLVPVDLVLVATVPGTFARKILSGLQNNFGTGILVLKI